MGVFKKVVQFLFLFSLFLLSALPCLIHEQNVSSCSKTVTSLCTKKTIPYHLNILKIVHILIKMVHISAILSNTLKNKLKTHDFYLILLIWFYKTGFNSSLYHIFMLMLLNYNIGKLLKTLTISSYYICPNTFIRHCFVSPFKVSLWC